ncbi:hypothetical protein GUJ93_ZPchr0003g18066 [Zizania palustris]|uniref:Uncharacterized protein n=1 Tax=Zizania palustris TaxID=103762 RepID=A0A8J5S0W1_ZIZPA|nr:hypothetical protein GUJ93_ZPchr0003g18066 [Zizania palustris]
MCLPRAAAVAVAAAPPLAVAPPHAILFLSASPRHPERSMAPPVAPDRLRLPSSVHRSGRRFPTAALSVRFALLRVSPTVSPLSRQIVGACVDRPVRVVARGRGEVFSASWGCARSLPGRNTGTSLPSGN